MKRIDRDGCEHVNGIYVAYSDVEALQKELDAANAQIVELKGSLSVHEKLCTEGVYFTDSELDVARAYWLKKAMGQSLAKVKADAVRTLLDDSSNWDSRIDGELYFTSSSIAAHADKIEEGV